MMHKDDILKVLRKYGFYSLNRAPYLYQSKDKIGIYFVWSNKHFGNLERVLYFDDEDSLEDAVFQYWWFINNKNKYSLEVEFDNYEKINPNILYKYKSHILTADMMRDFENVSASFVDPQEDAKKKQLIRTTKLIISVLKEKFKVQNDIFEKVTELAENLRKLTNTYNQKLYEYKKDKSEVPEEYEILIDYQDDSEVLVNQLYDELSSIDTIIELRSFIKTLFTYLKDIDSSEAHLQNVYLLNRYPFEIEDMKKKIDILEKHLNEKKRLFKNKKDALQEIELIEKESSCKKIVNIHRYIEKEKEQIIAKYDEINKIDENVLGDYLISFENLSIPIPPMIEEVGITQFYTKEEILSILKDSYEDLNKKEKSACFVASSFLKDCLNILIEQNATEAFNVNELISRIVLEQKIEIFNDAYQILDNYINAKIRVKYFSLLKMNSFETFISSLIEVLRVLNQMKLSNPEAFYVYFNNSDKEIIPLYLKNIFNYSNKTSFVGMVLKDIPVYYSPVEIVKKVDILDHTELIEREANSVFLLKNKVNIEKSKEKIVVVKYEKEKITNKKDYAVVTGIKEKNRCTYYESVVKIKEDGGTL